MVAKRRVSKYAHMKVSSLKRARKKFKSKSKAYRKISAAIARKRGHRGKKRGRR